jgi:hypothetical protein
LVGVAVKVVEPGLAMLKLTVWSLSDRLRVGAGVWCIAVASWEETAGLEGF